MPIRPNDYDHRSDMPDEQGARERQDRIAARAHQLYMERGREDGHAEEDWLQAEREVNAALEEESRDAKRRTSPPRAAARPRAESPRSSR
jgi:hypothetical protein